MCSTTKLTPACHLNWVVTDANEYITLALVVRLEEGLTNFLLS